MKSINRINKALGPGLAIQVNTVWISVRRISMVPAFESPAAERTARRILRWVKVSAPVPPRVRVSVIHEPVCCGVTGLDIHPSRLGLAAVPAEAWDAIKGDGLVHHTGEVSPLAPSRKGAVCTIKKT